MSEGASQPGPGNATEPLVSVVTVCLNAEAHIRNALESVLGQTYPRIEHVVIDGGSTDGTLDIIRELEPRFEGRMRWVSEPDEGLYDAMNKGIAAATGELLGTLNADDTYEPDAVQRAVEAWRDDPEAGVIYGDLRVFDASGESRVLAVPDDVSLSRMRVTMTLHHPATFISARAYRMLGGAYDTRYRIAADYDLLLRAIETGVRFKRVPGVLANFSLEGVSNKAVREADRETTRVRIAHGVNPLPAWGRYVKRALASRIYDALKHDARFREGYDRYKSAT